MNRIHTDLVSDARTLITDILSTTTDSIEKGLSRTKSIILGISLGPFLLNMIVTPYIFDVVTDEKKLQKINAKLFQLETAKLDKTSQDYEKAMFARNFQKKIYENVGNYTRTAKNIKLITAFGALLLSNSIITLSNPSSLNVRNGEWKLGLSLAIPSAAYALHHWRIRGAKLVATNKALAKQAMTLLSDSN